ncbi:MAG: aldose 1-epimerase family protein [Lachnospiraceae bacterium]|nr:aldose 1-epimerase family protein [Lachnospiraceae bacterium]
MVKLENNRLIAEIAERGSELVRIYDKTKEREMLWNGNPDIWPKHSPLLFPMVGRSYNNTYKHKGRNYEMLNHGFAWTSAFSFTKKEDTFAEAVLTDSEETLKNYPFNFKLTVGHKLEDNRIVITWKVENTGKDTMYYNIGAHPAFVTQPGIKTSDMYVSFPGKNSLHYLFTNRESGCALTQTVYEMPLKDGSIRITPSFWDNDAYIFEHQDINELGLLDENKAPYVTVKCNGFPFCGVWTKPGAPFVCLEPWYGRCNDDRFEGELKDKFGILSLQPGEKKDYSYTIVIE